MSKIKPDYEDEWCQLYHGDCLNIASFLNYDSVVSDPPYDMNFRSNRRKVKYKKIENDTTTDLLDWVLELNAKHSKYIFCRWNNLLNLKVTPTSCITWVKNNHSMGDLKHEHARKTEICLFFKHKDHFFPKQRPCDVIYSPITQNKLHPTEKPVKLMIEIVNYTNGIVFDPFMGSGSTGVACKKNGRKFIGIEKDKEYFDIAVDRIKNTSIKNELM